MPLASTISLPDRYRVVRHIASGGMASVWEAEDLLLGRVVAVKVLGAQFAADPGARARFQREARTAAQVSDQTNVVTIYDIGEHGDDAFIVMEHFAGGTVADRLRAARDSAQGSADRGARGAAGPGAPGAGDPGPQRAGDPGAQGSGDAGPQRAGDAGAQGSGDPGAQGWGDAGAQGAGDPGAQGWADAGAQGAGDPGAQGWADAGAQGSGDRGSRGAGTGGRVPRDTALRWLREAAAGLDVAHAAGIVHRDVKPANLLLDAHDRLAVGDFGIARLADDTQMTQTGQVLGTAAFISPEQALGQPATPASDRYALAVVAYELLTGSRPFAGGPPTALARQHAEAQPTPASVAAPDLPHALDGVLARGLAKDPRLRPATAAELVASIEAALADGAPAEATRPLAALAPTPRLRAQPPPASPPPAAAAPGRLRREPAPRSATPAAAAPGSRVPPATPAGSSHVPPATPAGSSHVPPTTPAGSSRVPPTTPADGSRVPPTTPADGSRVPPTTPADGSRVPPTTPADGSRVPPTTPAGSSRVPPSAAPATARRPPWPALLGAALLAAAAAGLVLALSGAGSEPQRPDRASSRTIAAASGTSRTATTAAAAPQPPPPPLPPAADASSPSALNDRGYALLRQGRYAEAIVPLRAAVQGFQAAGESGLPYAYALFNLAVALNRSGNPAEAAPLLRERLKFDDQRKTVQSELDDALAKLGAAQPPAQAPGKQHGKAKGKRDKG